VEPIVGATLNLHDYDDTDVNSSLQESQLYSEFLKQHLSRAQNKIKHQADTKRISCCRQSIIETPALHLIFNGYKNPPQIGIQVLWSLCSTGISGLDNIRTALATSTKYS
jgi:hypothetical protein